MPGGRATNTERPRAAWTAVSDGEHQAGAAGPCTWRFPPRCLRAEREGTPAGRAFLSLYPLRGRNCLQLLKKSHPGPRRRMDCLHSENVSKARERRASAPAAPLGAPQGSGPPPSPSASGCMWNRRLSPLWEAGKGRGEREGWVPGACRGGCPSSPAAGGLWQLPRGALPGEVAGRAPGTGLPALPPRAPLRRLFP